MIDIEEINKEIQKLENCDCTTYEICNKLAMLYTVRDHFSKTTPSSPAMRTTPMVPTAGI